MRLLLCGERAVLVDLAGEAERRSFDAALRAARASGDFAQVLEQVPAARTVLLKLDRPADVPSLDAALRTLALTSTADEPGPEELIVPVHYDGTDLTTLAAHLDVTSDDLISWHTAAPWTVDFAGFSPGFGYLVREPVGSPLDEVEFPRLDSPRTRIPAGSVAVAGRWSAVYPSATPGGWQLIGHTDLAIWDVTRDPPALFRPGVRVRFEAAR